MWQKKYCQGVSCTVEGKAAAKCLIVGKKNLNTFALRQNPSLAGVPPLFLLENRPMNGSAHVFF